MNDPENVQARAEPAATPAALAEQIADLRNAWPEMVPRDEAIWLVQMYASLASLMYAADAKESSARAVAEITNAHAIVGEMRAIMQRAEDEKRRILDVLFRDFHIEDDPAFAELYEAIAAVAPRRH
jgi:hypothetical protein